MGKSEKQRVKRKKIQKASKLENGQSGHVHTMYCQHTGVRFFREDHRVSDSALSKSEVVTIDPPSRPRSPLYTSMETTSDFEWVNRLEKPSCDHCQRDFTFAEPVKHLIRGSEVIAVVCHDCFPSKTGVPLNVMEFIAKNHGPGEPKCPYCSICDPFKIIYLEMPERGTLGEAILQCPETAMTWTVALHYNPEDLVDMAAFWRDASLSREQQQTSRPSAIGIS